MSYVIETYGRALTMQKIVPGDTVTGIGAEVYTYTERDLAFTSGGGLSGPVCWVQDVWRGF